MYSELACRTTAQTNRLKNTRGLFYSTGLDARKGAEVSFRGGYAMYGFLSRPALYN